MSPRCFCAAVLVVYKRNVPTQALQDCKQMTSFYCECFFCFTSLQNPILLALIKSCILFCSSAQSSAYSNENRICFWQSWCCRPEKPREASEDCIQNRMFDHKDVIVNALHFADQIFLWQSSGNRFIKSTVSENSIRSIFDKSVLTAGWRRVDAQRSLSSPLIAHQRPLLK